VASRPEGWAAIVSAPGAAPLRSLGQALGPELSGDPEALRRLAGFDDPETAFDLLVRWRRANDDALVVIDQFEELFTLNPAETQARFASLLGRLAAEADVHVLLSPRDDFLMRCHDHPALGPVFGELTPLGPLTRDGLRRALVEPALKHRYRFDDDALIEEMVAAVEGARAALPLLAFAVSRLWERRDKEKKLLTREAYREIGGVEGALAQHAEATYERIGSEREGIVREIFRNLTMAQGTRAVLDREELLSALPDRVAGEGVLRQLLDARLLTSYETEGGEGEPSRHRVEIVHESLLKAWPRLVRWQTQDADGAQLRDQLRQAAHLWEERGKTEDLLWTGTAYREFELWRERYPGALTLLEEQFARAMADKARRKKRLVRAAVAAIVLISTGVAIAIGVSRHKAIVAAQHAEASKLLAMAQLKLQEDPTEALAFATASLELADTSEARLFALRALAQAPPAWEVLSDINNSRIPGFSPDGRYLAVGGHSADVGVWKEDGGSPVRLAGHEPGPSKQGLWASDDLLVTGLGRARQVSIWSMPAGTKLRTIDFGGPTSWQVGNGHLFGKTEVPSSPEVFDLRSWRLPDGEAEALGRVDGKKLGTTRGYFEPHGRGWFYALGSTTHFLPLPVGSGGDRVFSRHEAEVRLHWITGRPEVLDQHDQTGEHRLLKFPENGPPLITILPKPDSAPPGVLCTDSDRWVSGNPVEDAELRLWDTLTLPGARPLELRREGSWYDADFSFHPAGKLLVATTHQISRLTFWPVPQRLPIVVDGYKSHYRLLAFSADGKWLATSWGDDRLRLWPLPGSGSADVKLINAPALLWSRLAFDPNGRYLFAVGVDGNAWIVPLDGSPGRKLDDYSKDTVMMATAVSPTGRRVATAFFYGEGSKTLRVWDVETGKVHVFELPVPPAPSGTSPTLTGFEGGVETLAFLDDSTLFTGGDGGIRRWNLDTGKHELIRSVTGWASMTMSSDHHELLFCEERSPRVDDPRPTRCGVIDLSSGAARSLRAFVIWTPNAQPALLSRRVTTHGPVFAFLDDDGSVRVGLRSGGEPHLLMGHSGMTDSVAISPDLRWVASTGEDNTLRLWPMPDLSKPPLHTLPHDELVTKLKSLTNLRAVPDPKGPAGWKIDLGPFPGWKNLPNW
jgi:WD40 repeat protein